MLAFLLLALPAWSRCPGIGEVSSVVTIDGDDECLNGVSANSAFEAYIYGSIITSEGQAVVNNSRDDNTKVRVYATGQLSASWEKTSALFATVETHNSADIINLGAISSDNNVGIHVRGGQALVTNNGYIFGGQYGIMADDKTANHSIRNEVSSDTTVKNTIKGGVAGILIPNGDVINGKDAKIMGGESGIEVQGGGEKVKIENTGGDITGGKNGIKVNEGRETSRLKILEAISLVVITESRLKEVGEASRSTIRDD